MWSSFGANHTSGKIKLTPPADFHTTVLLVSSLKFSQCTEGQWWFYGDVKDLNGGFWHWQLASYQGRQ